MWILKCPYLSQQRAGLQKQSFCCNMKEGTKPKAWFEPTLLKKSEVNLGAINCLIMTYFWML